MFNESLESLITNSDEQSLFWRTFLQSLQDHGGNTVHLNDLLADAKKSRELVDRMAQMTIGKVWELAKSPVNLDQELGDSELYCAPRDFLSRYPKIRVFPDLKLNSMNYTESLRTRPCLYQLFHFKRAVTFEEVINQCPYEHASWRELVAYVSRLESKDLCGCPILSAGSRNVLSIEPTGIVTTGTTFPAAFRFDTSIEISWRGVKRISDRFGREHFFLVRIYN
jgi:hypothetical protein